MVPLRGDGGAVVDQGSGGLAGSMESLHTLGVSPAQRRPGWVLAFGVYQVQVPWGHPDPHLLVPLDFPPTSSGLSAGYHGGASGVSLPAPLGWPTVPLMPPPPFRRRSALVPLLRGYRGLWGWVGGGWW